MNYEGVRCPYRPSNLFLWQVIFHFRGPLLESLRPFTFISDSLEWPVLSKCLICAICVQTMCRKILFQLICDPSLNFADLRSQLLSIHRLLFSGLYITVTISLLSDKPYPDLTRARKNKIRLSFLRRSTDFPKRLRALCVARKVESQADNKLFSIYQTW